MKTRMLTAILAVSLLVSLSVSPAAAVFSDLEGHWAKAYMEDLAEKGYFTGSGDGTMRPDAAITAGETLALLSRLYDPDEETASWILTDYQSTVEETAPPSLSWVYDELCVCLAAGIATKAELAAIDLTAKIEKEQLAVFLVRAMQLTDAAETAALPFDDTGDITEACRGSVGALVSAGIITGDEHNKFSPHSSVSRGVVAAMLSRGLDYLNSQGTTLTIPAYEGQTRTGGIVTSVSGRLLQVRGFDGLLREYTVPAAAAVTVNGAAAALGTVPSGCYALITAQDGAVAKVAADWETNVKWVQGVFTGAATTSAANTLYIKDPDSGSTTKYTVPGTAVITQDGKEIGFSALKTNNFVTLQLKDNAVTEVCSSTGSLTLSGTIAQLTFGTTVTLKMQDEDKAVYCFPLDISNLPHIARNDTAITIDRLNVGDSITITIAGCAVSKIAATASEQTVTGALTSILSTTSGITWVITAADGEAQTYTVDEAAGVYSGSKSISLSDIGVGDTVSVVVVSGTILEITLQNKAQASDKLTGTVLSLDTSAKSITLLSSGKLIYVNTSSVNTILKASTGKTVTLSSVPLNGTLVAYGAYSSSNSFAAVALVIED